MSLFQFSLDEFRKDMIRKPDLESEASNITSDLLKKSKLFTYIAALLCEHPEFAEHLLKTKTDMHISQEAFRRYNDRIRESINKETFERTNTLSPIFQLYSVLSGNFLSFLDASALLDNLDHVDVISDANGVFTKIRPKYITPTIEDNVYIFASMAVAKLVAFTERMRDNEISKIILATGLSDKEYNEFLRISIILFAHSFYAKSIIDVAAIDEWIKKHKLTNCSSYDDIRREVG